MTASDAAPAPLDSHFLKGAHMHTEHDKPASFHSSPREAMEAPAEEFLYLVCLHEGTGVEAPDFLAVVDAERGGIVHELPMPNVGDELHHFGWNRCSSACHGPDRSHLIVPGFRSSRLHIVNVADDPRAPRIEKVIEPEELVAKTGYTRPHTVHCMPGDNIVISMLGDAEGNGAGGFAVLDAQTFELKGRWENGGETPPFNYDFWYQPRKNALVSSEFGAPNAYEKGFDLDDVTAGRYGSRLHFWNLAERRLEQTVDLGETGLVPLEVRWLHDPDAEQGFAGAALSSTMWNFHRSNGGWKAEQVIAVEGIEKEGWPFPVPGLITDLVLSMDDRFLYFANWLHGDIRQYDVSDPAKPKLTAQLWLGGVLGKPDDAGRGLNGGPNMLQLSYDGRRLYVSNSLYSTWDNQFYPDMRSWLLRVNCDPSGGMEIDRNFFVDFSDRPDGPARAHEVRLQNGDCTTEIFQ
jgi:selenium-binding protein 1